jgi:leucyl-tRNA synthetase
VQVQGKVRARIVVPANADAGEVERIALADDKVQALLGGKAPRKVIVVPRRMVNLVLES